MVKNVKIKFHKPTNDKHFLWDEVEYFQFTKSLSKKYIDMVMSDRCNKRLFKWLRDENIIDYTYVINVDNIIFTFDNEQEAEKFSCKWIYDRMYFLYSMGLLETLGFSYAEMFYVEENYIMNYVGVNNRDTDEVIFYHGMISTQKV